MTCMKLVALAKRLSDGVGHGCGGQADVHSQNLIHLHCCYLFPLCCQEDNGSDCTVCDRAQI